MAEQPAATSNGVANSVVEEAPGVKVYAGNLAYAVLDEDLKSFFAPVHSEILTCQVIMHGTRSAGYGFVAVATHDAAQKACDALNGQDLKGRAVNVQIAKDADAKEKDKSERKAKRRVGRRGNKPATGEVTDAEANGEVEKAADGGVSGEEAKPKKKKSPRKKRTRAPLNGSVEGAETDAATGAPTTGADAEEKRARKPARTPRPKRAPGEEPVGEPSKTTLFVANLPFSFDDEKLSALFTDAGFTVSSARVVLARWGRPRKSKGFGFVEVGNEEAQKAAVEKLNGKELEGGRAISVKIAVDQQVNHEEGAEKTEVEVKEEATA